MTTTDPMHTAFEKQWRSEHDQRHYPRKIWLARDAIWAPDGYEQPTVHFAWEMFKAGAEWQKKQK